MTAPPELEAFAELALACVHREYPSQFPLQLEGDADARPPRAITPVFFGCYDWHSAVHAHWLLARAARLLVDGETAERCRFALDTSFSPAELRAEAAYLEAHPTFERPYGLAWALALHAELARWDDPEGARWAADLSPLADAASRNLSTWLAKLTHPIRSGVHSQTAFSMGLALDWARIAQRADAETALVERALAFHRGDRDCAIHLEPSGEDFLSPGLGAADLMRRVMPRDAFRDWLDRALGAGLASLVPATVSDPSDGRLAHLDGLNLSRAWMLRGVIDHLGSGDSRGDALGACADAHARAGLAAVGSERYEGAHWLGTFAARLLTGA